MMVMMVKRWRMRLKGKRNFILKVLSANGLLSFAAGAQVVSDGSE